MTPKTSATGDNNPVAPNILQIKRFYSIRTLYRAFYELKAGKRDSHRLLKYTLKLGAHVGSLLKRLWSSTYKPSKMTYVTIYCKSGQKERRIGIPSVDDLIVQRVVYDYVYPIIDKVLIKNNFGCRKGHGYLNAADTVKGFIRSSRKSTWYLQLDIRGYYYSLQPGYLRFIINRLPISDYIKFQLKLFTKPEYLCPGGILPQLFGLIYLNDFDHYFVESRGVRYVRYVDDIVIVGVSEEHAVYYHGLAVRLLGKIGLHLSKSKVAKISTGINFCGYINNGKTTKVRRRSKLSLNKALRKRDWAGVESCIAHLRHTANYRGAMERVIDRVGEDTPDHILRRCYEFFTVCYKIKEPLYEHILCFKMRFNREWSIWHTNPFYQERPVKSRKRK